ncbi:competence type IV pilus minor pilin ComGF [Virgibacillus sp. JSM 102003]|uniref:competence type IV pilus minor pilin ComGF n=1 Tax=Virgibacillus sp. JSM 102003 TaxID=1562108 RepID=UPI0035BF8814
MLKIRQIRFACTDILQNDKAFSFLSVILTISILFIIVPFTGYLLKGVSFTSNYDELSFQQFFYFLRDEVIESADIKIEPTRIILNQTDGSVVTIEQYQNLIRRKVDSKGHEIYLRDVQAVKFKSTAYGFHATITSSKGEQFEKTIIIYR